MMAQPYPARVWPSMHCPKIGQVTHSAPSLTAKAPATPASPTAILCVTLTTNSAPVQGRIAIAPTSKTASRKSRPSAEHASQTSSAKAAPILGNGRVRARPPPDTALARRRAAPERHVEPLPGFLPPSLPPLHPGTGIAPGPERPADHRTGRHWVLPWPADPNMAHPNLTARSLLGPAPNLDRHQFAASGFPVLRRRPKLRRPTSTGPPA